MQATFSEQEAIRADALAADLYAFVVFLHKSCTTDLFEALGAADLSLTQVKVLHHLEEAEQQSLKALAERIPVSVAAASRAIDDLVHRGFVERHEDPVDRRMKRVQVTTAGRTVSVRLAAARLTGLEQFATSLDPHEREILASALRTLLAHEEIAACRPMEASE